MVSSTLPSVYLAGAFSRREEILGYSLILKSLGFHITSRWLSEDKKLEHNEYVQRALMDKHDVLEADVYVRFTDDMTPELLPSYLVSGARMVEMGMAIMAGKGIFVIGGKQCIFDNLPQVVHFNTIIQFIQFFVPSAELI